MPRLLSCSAAEITFGQILELNREIFHAGTDLFDSRSEKVIEDSGRNSGSQADGGRDEGLRDTRSNSTQTGTPGIAKPLEGVYDAPHRTKQADERRNGRNRGQPAHVLFQLCDFLTDSKLKAA